ncbi:TPA: baseplate assembly protein [Yersinia enterocolitica]|uniref:baseplate assembly protein n=1 Tax=Yersinia enterocolitica TaxID=630 RepID=UPI0005FCE899|nr:baseplate assembly protein [Yersinia enterocolitica]EKN5933428.1 baseplate assembly protein [Yersinia enterocolitica]ELX2273936.1 baseplate assembly protein [Yersinia enterocolitica]ELY5259446.1 baseplate assembly protein [Yersinia enterocolitica]CRE88736.1 baseplate assembly protein [Yersinia enterocolitica]HDL6630354.1 baseplate assembly protein [Yersinia enterocolitica]
MAIIDLSQLPAPLVVESLDFDNLFAVRKEAFIALYPADQQDAVRLTLSFESEPIVKLLQESTYRELLLRQRVNEGAQAVMVAHAIGSDLDQLGANNGIARLTITAANPEAIPPITAVMESDDDFRMRIPQAFEGLSVAGPTGAYEYHARSADGRIADASAISPSPACVTVTVLSREGNGIAAQELLDKVFTVLNDENVRPVADRLTVNSATIVEYLIDATLYFYPGPEAEQIRAASEARLQTYISTQRRLGRDIRKSAIYAALHVEGVQRAVINAPLADVVLDKTQAAWCTGSSITVGGTDD